MSSKSITKNIKCIQRGPEFARKRECVAQRMSNTMICPWHSGLSEAVAAAQRTARSGVRSKARRSARSAYNKLSLPEEGEGSDAAYAVYSLQASTTSFKKPLRHKHEKAKPTKHIRTAGQTNDANHAFFLQRGSVHRWAPPGRAKQGKGKRTKA